MAQSGPTSPFRSIFDNISGADAGLDLEHDHDTLASAPRNSAHLTAVKYLRADYVPTGQLRRQVLSIYIIGDGATLPDNQMAYAHAVAGNGCSDLFSCTWVSRAGHCKFTPAETIAALQAVEGRLNIGRWDAEPDALNGRADSSNLGLSTFVRSDMTEFLRHCNSRMPSNASEH